jgi:hypothetical protein
MKIFFIIYFMFMNLNCSYNTTMNSSNERIDANNNNQISLDTLLSFNTILLEKYSAAHEAIYNFQTNFFVKNNVIHIFDNVTNTIFKYSGINGKIIEEIHIATMPNNQHVLGLYIDNNDNYLLKISGDNILCQNVINPNKSKVINLSWFTGNYAVDYCFDNSNNIYTIIGSYSEKIESDNYFLFKISNEDSIIDTLLIDPLQSNLFIFENIIYSVNNDERKIYSYNLNNKKTNEILDLNLFGTLKLFSVNENFILFNEFNYDIKLNLLHVYLIKENKTKSYILKMDEDIDDIENHYGLNEDLWYGKIVCHYVNDSNLLYILYHYKSKSYIKTYKLE